MATATRTTMVTGVFRTRDDAELVYQELRRRGYSDADINVLMSDKTRSSFYGKEGSDKALPAGSHATEGMGVGGAIGTAVGATLGAVAAIGTSVVLPGLGLVVAGPLAAALAGGGAGAAAGGLLGALIGYGIPEENAQAYHDAVRDGGVVIGVLTRKDDKTSELEKLFRDRHGDSVLSTSR
jgi:hypothetical protein